MVIKYVNTRSLNFRSEPRVTEHSKISALHLGQSVEVTGVSERAGWVSADVVLDETKVSGFLSEKYLRAQVSQEREELIQQAVSEWLRFRMGLGKEFEKPYFEFVGEMWQAIGMNLNGRDRDVPWSAAAISFMVKNAGVSRPQSKYSNFKFAAAHARYIHDSIMKREKDDSLAPFWGMRLEEQHPQVGDLVCRSRAGQELSFDFARTNQYFKSHCDLIVGMSDDRVLTIGGNVGHSVKITEYDLTPQGFLDDTKRVFMFLANTHK